MKRRGNRPYIPVSRAGTTVTPEVDMRVSLSSLALCVVVAASVIGQSRLPVGAARLLERPVEHMPASVAIRRLEASAQRFAGSGWIRVRVTVEPGERMFWDVLEQGGSKRIREDVLLALLEEEAESVKRNDSARGEISLANYRVSDVTPAEAQAVPAGLLRFRLHPKRRDPALVDGTVWVNASSGDLVQMDGQLSKSPSFWATAVYVLRRYGRIEGVRVPVYTESAADVRLAGRTTLRMTYEYETINGRPTRPE
ncbi:MAG: hypothetical protein AB7L71_05725 [Vicinamibacterales bacterium]